MRLPSWLAPYRALDRGVWLIAVARGIAVMGFSMVLPFMAIHFVRDRGTSLTAYAAIQMVAGLVAAVVERISGALSDRLGRRRVMLTALVLRTVNMLALGFFVDANAPLAVLATLLITNRALWGAFEPAASAAITDLVPADDRAAGFGLQRIGINVGWAVGPALGGFLVATHSYSSMFFAVAPATLLGALAVRMVGGRAARAHGDGLAVARPHDSAWSPASTKLFSPRALGDAYANNPVFFVYLGLVFVLAVGLVQVFSALTVYADQVVGLAEGRVGQIYTVNALVVVFFQVPAVALIRKMGLRVPVLVGCALFALGFVLVGASRSFWPLAGCMVVISFGEVLLTPALMDLAALLGDPKRMGRSFGLMGLMRGIGYSLGPLLGGVAFDHFHGQPLVMWSILAGVMVVALLGFAGFWQRFDVPEHKVG